MSLATSNLLDLDIVLNEELNTRWFLEARLSILFLFLVAELASLRATPGEEFSVLCDYG